MDFINKLINRPKSMPASTSGMASDLEIESLLAEIQENLNHKNQVRRILFTRFQGLALFLLCLCFGCVLSHFLACDDFAKNFGPVAK